MKVLNLVYSVNFVYSGNCDICLNCKKRTMFLDILKFYFHLVLLELDPVGTSDISLLHFAGTIDSFFKFLFLFFSLKLIIILQI